jgi:hypothetical protein
MPPRKRARSAAAKPDAQPLVIKARDAAAVDSFREELISMWREGRLCDVTILVEGRSFPAHRLVLSAESPEYMKPMLTTSFAESRDNKVSLQEVTPALFEAALEFMCAHAHAHAHADEYAHAHVHPAGTPADAACPRLTICSHCSRPPAACACRACSWRRSRRWSTP